MAQVVEREGQSTLVRWRSGGRAGKQHTAYFDKQRGPHGWERFRKALEFHGHPAQPPGWQKSGTRWLEVAQLPQALQELPAATDGPTLASYGLETLQGKWLGGDDYYRLRSLARFRDHISPQLGHLQVSELKARHLNDWQLELKLAPKSITSLRTLLHAILDRAVSDELLPFSPLRSGGVKAPKRGRKQASAVPTMENLRELERAVVEVDELLPFPGDPTFAQDAWAVLFAAGLRMGEFRALRTTSLQGSFLVVRKAVKRAVVKGKECGSWEGDTKSEAGQDRRIALGPKALAVVQRRIERTTPGGLLFPAATDSSRLLAHSVWNRRMHLIVTTCRERGAELPADRTTVAGRNRLAITAHGLRKAYSSWLQHGGATLAAASKSLGHANVGITASTYTVDISDDAAALKAAADMEALQELARRPELKLAQ